MKPKRYTRRPDWLFVYGGPLDAALRARCCPNAGIAGPARLPGHTLGFFGYTARWDGAEAAVFESPGAEVWGLLMALGRGEADALDQEMGVHEDGSGPHFLCPVEVEDAQGRRHEALMHQLAVLGPPRTPSREYLARLVAGATAAGLPAAWCRRLAGFEAHAAGYPVPHGQRTIRVGVTAGTCHC
ncbi:MAG: gamma-glutamylcyclotransferase family protein [Rubrivivax sp.]